MAAAPMAAAAAAPMMNRAPIQIDASEFEVQNGSQVAEVVAMFGNAVLDVQPVGQLKNKKSRAPMFLAIGGLLMIAGTGVFLNEVGQAETGLGYRNKLAEANESGGVRPLKPGNGLPGLGVGLALLGLVPFGFRPDPPRRLREPQLHDRRSRTACRSTRAAARPARRRRVPAGAGQRPEFALNFTQGTRPAG
ncbi:MAG: hypothetical protein IPO88_33620 [Nannocystis sp.]|nr:hypothetical protein [Nannocystis sp.]